MKRKIIKNEISSRWLCFMLLVAGILLFFSGCQSPIDALMGNSSSGSDTEVVELADNTPIPADGIITAAQFRSIAGTDRVVTFSGTTEDGTTYVWTFKGTNIKNPVDQNLKISVSKDDAGVSNIKSLANGAPYGLGITIDGSQGLITVPQLTLTLNEKWDADTAVYCKAYNGQAGKISNVTFDNTAETTRMTFNVTETGEEYFLVGGKTIAPAISGSTGTTTTESGGTAGGTGGSSGGGGTSGNTCTLSISCSTILNNMGNLTSGKEGFVPSDGWILPATTVEFSEGESVYDVLNRVCQANGIHMESSFTPMYNSSYIEGINQLYEFDCGQLSGWMYNVNGWFPNYGCSQYVVANGDVINWVYTCDLGRDVGDNSMW